MAFGRRPARRLTRRGAASERGPGRRIGPGRRAGRATEDERHLTDLASSLGFETRSILCVPLSADGRVLGAIEVLNKRGDDCFGDEDLRVMTVLAGQVAQVLRAAQERPEEYQDLIITRDSTRVKYNDLMQKHMAAQVAHVR